MTGRRYPWRVVAFATIVVFGNFYLAYYLLFGLASDGVDVRDASGRPCGRIHRRRDQG
jgi:hypothetical protein